VLRTDMARASLYRDWRGVRAHEIADGGTWEVVRDRPPNGAS